MDEAAIRGALYIVAVVLVYAVLCRGLLYATEPFRAKMLDLYQQMIASDRMEPALRELLDEYMDKVYSSWAAWQLAGVMICAVFVVLPTRKIAELFVDLSPIDALEDVPEPLKKDFDRFTSYAMAATIANSPLALAIFALAGVIGVALFVQLKVISRIVASHRHGTAFLHRAAH
ncbi:hypothetical protein [Bradyrhizobium sp. SZCCHNR1093]|uniref:hypothetical protein n=1 Tax=Bradyrhizobium sp. SZCCHNR1093 TaxID=3057368 RepID=UPI0028EB828F|nr:hypothetical protein [Bradyrhizobium sp. SZCCHNR1093]